MRAATDHFDGRRFFNPGDRTLHGVADLIRWQLAMLPIGAYEPRWFMQPMHLNPAEAVQASLDLGAARAVAMHFGCFQLTDEGIDEPVRALDEALSSRGVPPERFRVLSPGETLTVTSGKTEGELVKERTGRGAPQTGPRARA